MSGKIEYLEQYTVAPSPSRDYYGLKVLHDEVILYLWRISHGPHKAPLVHKAHFLDFSHNKLLQDEISHAFGNRLLKHIHSITSGETKTLLTLPRCVIKKLSKHLHVQDIVNLSSLSHVANTIFNDNSLWKSLCKRFSETKGYKFSGLHGMACDWKKSFKEEHLREYLGEKKTQGRTISMIGKGKVTRNVEISRPTNLRSKTAAKLQLADIVPPKAVDQVSRKLEQKPQKQVATKQPKVGPLEKMPASGKQVSEIKSLQRISQTNIKNLRKQPSTSVNKVKSETITKSVVPEQTKESKPLKEQVKVQRRPTNSKTNLSIAKATDSKLSTNKTKSPLISKATKSEKSNAESGPNTAQVKNKTKKISQSKSTILTTDKVFGRGGSMIKNESLDLTDLIEASLKNICSPRTIFDSEFSFIDSFGGCVGDSKLRLRAQEKRYKKLGSSKGTRLNRMGTVLESVSEKSEPATTRITDLEKKIERLSDIVSSSSKDLHSNAMKADKRRLKKDKPLTAAVGGDRNDYYERFGVSSKSFTRPFSTPEAHNTQAGNLPQTKLVDKIDVLKWLGTSSISSRSPFGAKREHCEMEKALEDLYKQKFRRKN